MHILHYLNSIDLAERGVVRCVLPLASVVAAEGHRVTLVTRNAKDLPPEWQAGPDDNRPAVVELNDGPGKLGTLSDAEAARVEHIITHEKPDLAHLHTAWQPVNITLSKLCEKHRLPFVLSIHGMLDDWSMAQSALKKRLYHRFILKAILRRAAAVHCTAQAEKDQSEKWYPGTPGVVVPLVFDTAPYTNLPGPDNARTAYADALADDGSLKLLFLSRVHVKKGLEHLLRAARVLTDRGETVTVLVAGSGDPPGYLDKMRQLARDLDIHDRTHFLGLVTGDTKVSLFQAADIFVLPTSQENFGFVFPEALACATPVVTTKGVDTWPELQASGGANISTQDPEDIASAVLSFRDPATREHAGARGREWVLQHLDPRRVAARFIDLYDAAAKGHAPDLAKDPANDPTRDRTHAEAATR